MTIKSILPPHFAELEKVLDRAGGTRLALLSNQDTDFWNPDLCPEPYLPLLAWAHSVDYWDSSWPVHLKRNVIREAPGLHRIKGTKAAVLNALATLNVNADYHEWHEIGTQKGTFRITAFLSENSDINGRVILGEKEINQLHQLIQAVKRGSHHYELRTLVDHNLDLGLNAFGAGSLSSNCIYQQSIVSVEPVATIGVNSFLSNTLTTSTIGS